MMLYGPLAVWILVSAFGPYDTIQGPSSKLLYVHVPTVWIAYLAYTLTFIYSLSFCLMMALPTVPVPPVIKTFT